MDFPSPTAQHERGPAETLPQAVDRSQDSGAADDPALDSTLTQKVEQHEADQTGQQPLSGNPGQRQDDAHPDEKGTQDVLAAPSREAKRGMTVHPDIAGMEFLKVLGGQPPEEESRHEQAADDRDQEQGGAEEHSPQVRSSMSQRMTRSVMASPTADTPRALSRGASRARSGPPLLEIPRHRARRQIREGAPAAGSAGSVRCVGPGRRGPSGSGRQPAGRTRPDALRSGAT